MHVTPALFGKQGVFGGAERYSLELARHMSQLTRTRIVAFGATPEAYKDCDLDVQVLGPATAIRGHAFNRFHISLWNAIRGFDVVHCHQPCTFASEFASWAGWLRRQRVFATDLGGGGWGANSYFNTKKWFRKHLHISQYSRCVAGQEEWDRASVIYGGVDTELFVPQPSIAKEPLVVFAGRLMPHKGVDYLVQALPPGLRLELIGRPYNESFLAVLKKHAEGKNVTFRHDCDDHDLILAYQRALCVVLPSVYRDCFGNESKVPELLGQTLMEGMACGTAAICSNVASMPEVVVNEVTGFVVPPNDTESLGQRLIQLRDNRELAKSLGEAGRKRILEHFTWRTVVNSCLRAYES